MFTKLRNYVLVLLPMLVIESDLSEADFTQATLIACQLYDCKLDKTIYIKSKFRYLKKTEYINRKKTSKDDKLTKDDILPCSIKYSSEKQQIENCHFDEALFYNTNLSNNIFTETHFKEAKLYQSNLTKSKFTGCHFHESILPSATLVEAELLQCELIKSRFTGANLREAKFIDSNLTGVDFRFADLTLLTLNKCHLNNANFFKTKRGGITIKDSKIIKYIEWSPQVDGQVQIDEKTFLKIIEGTTSPSTAVGKLVKEGGSIMQNYINAEINPKNIIGDNIDVEKATNSEIIGISYNQSSETEKLKSEIQKLLNELPENYRTAKEGVTTEIVKGEINSNPSLKQRLQSALRAGGIEALKSIFQHPGVKISIETIKGFLEGQQKCS